jgi:hypothetical protein
MTRRMAFQMGSAMATRSLRQISKADDAKPKDLGPPASTESASDRPSRQSLRLRRISDRFGAVGTRLRTLNDELSRNVLLPKPAR